MERSLALFVIGLIFGGGIGFVAAASNGITLDGHDHSDPNAHQLHAASNQRDSDHSGHHAGHNHDEIVSVPSGPEAPTLEISVSPDPASGFNLHIKTENFTFAPERASLDHVPGEGHAHVYVNGAKVTRHYSSWLHLPTLPEGDTTIEVTLNTNDHRMLGVDNKPLKATAIVPGN
ncbi:hypothetical protein [uncultured Roseibium sp.]|uniref:hypothetical protein n=1 Tax=uncultured Roseibium sp. TaxID=1936171 RepID=UPI002615D4CD|nr:hypothetical protein [uncultured Roseibium sp.]